MCHVERNRSAWLALLTAVGVLIGPLPAFSDELKPPTLGKYFCYIGSSVGLQTNSQTGNRYAGKITYPENETKFFVTIEENNQPTEDWCFGSSALDDLKKIRRGEKIDSTSKTYFLNDGTFYDVCLARYKLKISGGPLGHPTYFASAPHVFRDLFSQFWISNDLSYVWYADNSSGDHYLTEGKCEKIN
jgi:hypothetical protein